MTPTAYAELSAHGRNGRGRLSNLGAPRPSPLHHRVLWAQIQNGLYLSLDESRGSGHWLARGEIPILDQAGGGSAHVLQGARAERIVAAQAAPDHQPLADH